MVTKVKTDCAFKDKCTDVGKALCLSCLNNNKRSYYRQDYQPYYPIYPIYPTWPWNERVTWYPWHITDTDCGDTEVTLSHYSPVSQ